MASISTPVRAVTAAVAVSVTVPSAASSSASTSTWSRPIGWHSGISSPVRLAAWMPAIRATPSTSPLGASPAADALGRGRGHAHDGAGDGAPRGDLLGADVDHPRGALGVEVGEVAHQAGATALRAPSMRSRTAWRSPARSSAIGSGSPLTIPSKKSLRS